MSRTTQNQQTDPQSGGLRALFPAPGDRSLEGLYLSDELRHCLPAGGSFVYSNFITSLDGRIAIAKGDSVDTVIPGETANPRDWRLLLELAAPADAIIVSGRFLRQLAEGSAQACPPLECEVPEDIIAFRHKTGLPPQPAMVIVSNSLDLPSSQLTRYRDRKVIVATSDAASRGTVAEIKGLGVDLIRAGNERVDGEQLISGLLARDLRLIYSIAGPAVMHTLLRAGVLGRLYLTTVLRILSGKDYASLIEGGLLDPPYDFELNALYLDDHGPDGVQQLLQVFDRRRP